MPNQAAASTSCTTAPPAVAGDGRAVSARAPTVEGRSRMTAIMTADTAIPRASGGLRWAGTCQRIGSVRTVSSDQTKDQHQDGQREAPQEGGRSVSTEWIQLTGKEHYPAVQGDAQTHPEVRAGALGQPALSHHRGAQEGGGHTGQADQQRVDSEEIRADVVGPEEDVQPDQRQPAQGKGHARGNPGRSRRHCLWLRPCPARWHRVSGSCW